MTTTSNTYDTLTPTLFTTTLFASFFGQFTRGATGYGSAIVFQIILIIIALNAGADTVPTLRCGIVSECLASYICAIMLLFKLNVKKHVLWSVALSITFSTFIFAPIGAYLLNVLDKHTVQLVVGSILIIVFCNDAYGYTNKWLKTRNKESSDLVLGDSQDESSNVVCDMEMRTLVNPNVPKSDQSHASEDPNVDQMLSTSDPSHLSHSSSSSYTFLLFFISLCPPSLNSFHTFLTSKFGANGPRELQLGLLAGCFSGICGGLSGIPGPPIFILLQYLNLSPPQIQTTGSVMTVIAPRPIVYMFMGNMRQGEVPLYFLSSLVGLAGAFCGNYVSKGLDKERLKVALTGLVLLGAVLMFIAGSGMDKG